MDGNTFGQVFRLTTFGESHGEAIGGIISGCPAGLEIDLHTIQEALNRRRPGQSAITTQRKEADQVIFLSGIYEGKTTGSPIGFMIRNQDQQSKDYDHLKEVYRPSHADYTWEKKYGYRDHRGGGRSSARETACRVVGGAIAAALLSTEGIEVNAYVSQAGEVKLEKNYRELDLTGTFNNVVRCPDEPTAKAMQTHIETVRDQGDTIGGIITGIVSGLPAGLGEPVFDKLHADLGKAMLSINAVKGFEYGSGFAAAEMTGSKHNDRFVNNEGDIKTESNYSGGIQGGISNGEDVYFRVAFKPVATLMNKQQTVDKEGKEVTLEGKGRHDPCVVPRAVPIVGAMAALVVVDHLLRNKTSKI